MRLALFGLFGSPNLGNEATFAAFLHGVRRRCPQASFVCIAPRQSKVVQMHGVEGLIDMVPLPVAPWFWRLPNGVLRDRLERVARALTSSVRQSRATSSLINCDAFVVPGTGVIDDFGQGPDDLPSHFECWATAAVRAGIPVHVLSVGASRVDHPQSRDRLIRALRCADSCSFRDGVSARNARALGYSGELNVCPDLAFSLPRELLPNRTPQWPPKVIGLGVMGFRGWNADAGTAERCYRDYLHRTAELARGLMTAGYSVRLLIGDTQADRDTPADLLAMLKTGRGRLDLMAQPAISSFGDLLHEIGECDLVVAARYHNVLLSLMTGRPAVSLGYSDKNDAVMADMGQAAWCHDIATFQPGTVLSGLAKLTGEESPTQTLLLTAAAFRSQLEQQFDALGSALR